MWIAFLTHLDSFFAKRQENSRPNSKNETKNICEKIIKTFPWTGGLQLWLSWKKISALWFHFLGSESGKSWSKLEISNVFSFKAFQGK